ncbi:MAG TPA: glycerol kinase GlpK, partial [Dehalococcoidia bacterium]|nr:glycerol kinase GlpK [Dehalococcoidia bacterium]
DLCEALKTEGLERRFAVSTGLTIDPYFSGTKLWWLFDEVPGLLDKAERGEIVVGTIDSWLIWNLTAGAAHVTDYTNASRTLLFNIRSGRWDLDLCNLMGVPVVALPEVRPSSGLFGETHPDVFGARVPITGVAGDQQSALFGQWCLRPGVAKNTYGTGCFLLAPAGRRAEPSLHRLVLTLGATSGEDGPEYAYEGSVFVAGAAVQWLRDELGLVRDANEIEALARSVDDSNGVVFVPAFTGLGAPRWDPNARGLLIGLTRGTSKAHIARAALDAIALSSADLVAAMSADLKVPMSEIRVDGGASRNDLLMQLQADLAGIPVVRPRETETTVMGAAFLAGLGAGLWRSSDEVGALWQSDAVFEPSISNAERQDRLGRWRDAVERSGNWAR